MAVGLNFGKRAANLLEQGAATSTSAMAIGGAVVGGAYEGILGDGDMLGGAMMGAGLGTAAKFASNMYSIGAKSANSGSFKFSNFTEGYEQASRRNAVMGLGFNQRGASRGANSANMNTSNANTSSPVTPSASANTSSTSAPYVPSSPSATSANTPMNEARRQGAKEAFGGVENGASIRHADAQARWDAKRDAFKNDKERLTRKDEKQYASENQNRRLLGGNVSEEAQQRLLRARIGDSSAGTYIPNRSPGSSFIGPLPGSNKLHERAKEKYNLSARNAYSPELGTVTPQTSLPGVTAPYSAAPTSSFNKNSNKFGRSTLGDSISRANNNTTAPYIIGNPTPRPNVNFGNSLNDLRVPKNADTHLARSAAVPTLGPVGNPIQSAPRLAGNSVDPGLNQFKRNALSSSMF